MTTIHDLETFIGTLKPEPRSDDESEIEKAIDANYISDDPWTIWKNPPWNDFTREVIEPGYTVTPEAGPQITYHDGAIVIRGDVNFWVTAVLPRHFEVIPFPDVVKLIWPDIDTPTIYPDDGDIYWDAIDNQDMRV